MNAKAHGVFAAATATALAIGLGFYGMRAADPVRDSAGSGAAAVVPFELVDNRIFVEAKLNGSGPFHILLDTGAGSTVRTEVAKKLAMPKGKTSSGTGVGTATVEAYESKLNSIEIGAARLENVATMVMSFDDTPAVFGNVPVDGYMGYEFYAKYVVKHDYENQTITFLDSRAFVYEGKGVVLNVESADYVPVVEGKLDGEPARFGIDTGARSSLLLYGPYVVSHGLEEKYNPKFQGVTGWGIGGPVRSEIARIGSVELGSVKLTDVVARFSLNKTGATAGNSKAGLVGPDILKQFTLICDYPRKRLILEKNRNFGQRDTYDKFGAWIAQSGDQFEVIDVIAGSAAEQAGVKAGDRIVAIEGKRVAGLRLTDVRDRLKYARTGTKVALKIRRGQEEKDVVVELKELV